MIKKVYQSKYEEKSISIKLSNYKLKLSIVTYSQNIPNHKEEGIYNFKIFYPLSGYSKILVRKVKFDSLGFLGFESHNQTHKIKLFSKSKFLTLNFIKYGNSISS